MWLPPSEPAEEHGDLRGAELRYRKVLDLEPSWKAALVDLGRVLLAQDDIAGAEALYRTAPHEADVVEALQPCWEVMGATIVRQGGPGAGQHTKMVNQVLIATNMIGVCEALLYGYRAGLDLVTVMKSVASGAAGSWSLSNLGARIIDNNFDPGFFVEHFIKDMTIAIEEAERMGLELPGLTQAKALYEKLRELGHAKSGTQALILALRNA